MTKTYAVMLPLLLLWLVCWIFFSWGAVQDDALIHLRYASNLAVHHFITYDGVHANYGASSLLYVAVLATLRGLTDSPNLPRATSSAVHVLLFAGMAYGFCFCLPRETRLARLAGLALLALLVTPSAVRWLDDGMETGAAVSLAALMAWLLHRQNFRVELGDESFSGGRYLGMTALGFFAVMLRIELLLLCGCGFLTLASGRCAAMGGRFPGFRPLLRDSHLLVGAGMALCTIVATMHDLLPDTAIAKSHGLSHWLSPIQETAVTLGGAMSLGVGLLVFWLLTLVLAVFHRGRLKVGTVLANSFFPVELTLASLRGQEIQGARYFAWTFVFSIVWNLLVLAEPAKDPVRRPRFVAFALYAFLAFLAIEVPFEAVAMAHVLSHRGQTMRTFAAQHLDALRLKRGIASDIGYIGYFTQADICDLAGLVNGREASRMASVERAQACLKTDADFLFVNVSQLVPLARMTDLSGWTVCGHYDFTNVKRADIHYLLVRPGMTEIACSAAARLPEPIESILPPQTLAEGVDLRGVSLSR